MHFGESVRQLIRRGLYERVLGPGTNERRTTRRFGRLRLVNFSLCDTLLRLAEPPRSLSRNGRTNHS